MTFLRPPAASNGKCAHIASLLVYALADRIEAVRAAIASVPGAELHPTTYPGKFVVLLESSDDAQIARCIHGLHAAPGVLAVSIVAHFVEDAGALSEAISHDSDSPPSAEG